MHFSLICFCLLCYLLVLRPAQALPLPAGGQLLEPAGWSFRAGPDSARGPAWQPLDPTRSLFLLPAARRAGQGWWRYRLVVPAAWVGRPMAFALSQTGATEIYLDGRLVSRRGRLPGAPGGEQTLYLNHEPVPVRFTHAGPTSVLVRWSFGADNLYFLYSTSMLFQGTPAVRLEVHTPTLATARYLTDRRLDMLQFAGRAGMLFFAGFVHLMLFLWSRRERGNLYYAGYALPAALGAIVAGLAWLHSDHTAVLFRASVVEICCATVAAIFGLATIYAMVNEPRGRLFGLLSVMFVLAMAVNFLGWWAPFFTTYTFAMCIYADAIRVSLLGWRRHELGSAAVLTAMLTGGTLYAAGVLLPVFTPHYVLGNALLNASYLTNPLILSVLLGQRYALTGTQLAQKLREVKELSARTRRQEQERQQLLASQNDQLERQVAARTSEVVGQRNRAEAALATLRITQNQLIQREKMASLGELTAGIAHEIQNPLNFVTNFSDVSTELCTEAQEMLAALALPPNDTLDLTDVLANLRQNQTKISQHGQRAAGIVRGMLEHSHTSTGERAAVNLNALCDEYLHLAYHGLRAKAPAFTADLQTDFAPDLPLVEAVGADLSRVLLNLFTNAFYAVRQRWQLNGATYQPVVRVSTQQTGQYAEICVWDNGTGMSDAVRRKVFQPFFTTKPTGEGTGLGLSLSYDIITQGHGGTLTVESREGHHTEFVVRLPI
ncbi:ATP-binding protein [Hymenobacter psychrophilus]|uniref:histidine kinase n=1 Tax=Hymenobacter psychrophilus TaxID=651662 RepID=A0A1H3BKT3_9BACT|nr:ATP-binding protein [Hymenobacter psychrophilus]SDX42385.1 His Kinase A (phospho-acceptor) domain-containing protein [Hymenobacter psychrophilus]